MYDDDDSGDDNKNNDNDDYRSLEGNANCISFDHLISSS